MKHLFTLILPFALIFSSCTELPVDQGVDDSLKAVEEVRLIEGAEQATIIVNRETSSMFRITVEEVSNRAVFLAGDKPGWCIDWQKPINSDGGIYADIKAFTTTDVDSWDTINFILNNLDELHSLYPGLGYREIQLAIWSLRGHPEFNLDEVDLQELPPRFLENGNPLFDPNLVKDVLKFVENHSPAWNYSEGDYYAVIFETPADVQTVIAVVQ